MAAKRETIQPRPNPNALPSTVNALRRAALERQIRVIFLPAGLQRRRDNTSFVNARKKQIQWRVEWLISIGNIVPLRYFEDQYVSAGFDACLASKRISDLGDHVVSPPVSPCLPPISSVSENLPLASIASRLLAGRTIKDEILRERIATAMAVLPAAAQPSSTEVPAESLVGFSILFKPDGQPANAARYYRFPDLSLSLRLALAGLTILEHPTLYLVADQALDRFNLLSSREELVQMCNSANSPINQLAMVDARQHTRSGKREGDRSSRDKRTLNSAPSHPLIQELPDPSSEGLAVVDAGLLPTPLLDATPHPEATMVPNSPGGDYDEEDDGDAFDQSDRSVAPISHADIAMETRGAVSHPPSSTATGGNHALKMLDYASSGDDDDD
ncbi:hypothetical protein, variant 1, partial [Capsaspora owczarzaki ATCC 30864]